MAISGIASPDPIASTNSTANLANHSSPGEQNALYELITNNSVLYIETRCLVEAINDLYLDPAKRELKRGSNAKDQPGNLSRLLAVIDQLDLTYEELEC